MPLIFVHSTKPITNHHASNHNTHTTKKALQKCKAFYYLLSQNHVNPKILQIPIQTFSTALLSTDKTPFFIPPSRYPAEHLGELESYLLLNTHCKC